MIPLSPSFDAGLALAHRIHREQTKKGTDVPYLAHILSVTAIVLEDGGDETQAIAALLHDAIEDAQPVMTAADVRKEIHDHFGEDVLEIVEHCTDTDQHPKPPWRDRKVAYVASLAHAPSTALRVSAADKLSNVRAIIRDYRQLGDAVWSRFNPGAGKAGVIGYYRALADVFSARMPGALAGDLDRAVQVLEELSGHRGAWPPSEV
ncbi:MAG: HD domain-containing protein [Acidobacteriota bacterium]